VGAVLFGASFGLLHVWPWSGLEVIDTPVYQKYGDATLAGQVPYRDFVPEYPPGALPVFILPSLAATDDYRPVFEVLMLLCGMAAVAFMAWTLAAVGASPRRLYGAVAFAGLAPLLLGSVILTRYDLWPAAIAVAAVAAIVSDRSRLGLGLLAVGAAAKIWPGVLLPIALLYIGRRKGARETVVSLAIFAAVLACIVLPFAIIAPDGFWLSLERQTGRPLQLESLSSAVLLAGHQLHMYEAFALQSYGSHNLVGELPSVLATVHGALQALLVAGVWLAYLARRHEATDADAFLRACATAICVFVAFGKVLSPQFLIWLFPLVPLVAGRRGVAASSLLFVALLLTQLWFPKRYWQLVAFEAYPTWLLLARDVVLVALAGVLALNLVRERARPRSP
jgi:uncharacterized membrane protein